MFSPSLFLLGDGAGTVDDDAELTDDDLRNSSGFETASEDQSENYSKSPVQNNVEPPSLESEDGPSKSLNSLNTSLPPTRKLISAIPEISIDDPSGPDATNSDVEDEYFEEYHLPNSHQNAFVRHRSFRRNVCGV